MGGGARHDGRLATAALLVAALLAAGCGTDESSATDDGDTSSVADPSATAAAEAGPTAVADRCLVRLHGKGGAGADPSTADGVTTVAPTGNADGWEGRQWLYFPADQYESAKAVVEASIDGCTEVIIDGFSNGASFAAKLYCRGETFDGRLVRVVVDDPVVDRAVEGCTPSPDVGLTLYWTGALEDTAEPGWDCSDADWTCEGGSTIGIEAYAAALDTTVVASPFDEHEWYLDAPEVAQW